MKRIFAITLAMVTFCAMTSAAQTGINVAVGTSAMAVHYQSNWYAVPLVYQTVDVKDWTPDANGYVNSLAVRGDEMDASATAGFKYFGGGFQFTPTRTLASLVKSTNIPADSVRIYFRGTVGSFIPNAGTSHITGNFGAGGSVALNQSGTIVWNTIEGGCLMNTVNYCVPYVSSGFTGTWGIDAQSSTAAKARRTAAAIKKLVK